MRNFLNETKNNCVQKKASVRMRISQIGLGRIGFLLEEDPLRYKPCTHLGTLLALAKQDQSMNIVGLCDIDNTKIQATEKKLSRMIRPIKKIANINFTQNYKDILQKNPDFLVIASTTHSHYKILADALKQGISKILIEKPLVMDKKALRTILKLYDKHSSQVWVNYERRYYEKYIQLKKLLKTQYGKIISYRGLMVCPSHSFYPYQKYEGLLLHDTTHILDLIIFFFGIPNRFKALKNKNPTIHHILCEHSQLSLHGEIVSIRHPKSFHFELEVLTENARISVGNGYTLIEKITPSTSYSQFYSLDVGNKENFKKDKKPSTKTNSFVRLYKEVISNKKNQDNFADSYKNVELLLRS